MEFVKAMKSSRKKIRAAIEGGFTVNPLFQPPGLKDDGFVLVDPSPETLFQGKRQDHLFPPGKFNLTMYLIQDRLERKVYAMDNIHRSLGPRSLKSPQMTLICAWVAYTILLSYYVECSITNVVSRTTEEGPTDLQFVNSILSEPKDILKQNNAIKADLAKKMGLQFIPGPHLALHQEICSEEDNLRQTSRIALTTLNDRSFIGTDLILDLISDNDRLKNERRHLDLLVAFLEGQQ